MPNLEFSDLRAEVEALLDEKPLLKDHQAFVVWFLQAFAGAAMEEATKALPGKNREKGIDGVLIDTPTQQVIVVQGKYHKSIGSAREGREVVTFSSLSDVLQGSAQEFAEWAEGENPLDEAARAKLTDARHYLRRNYRLHMCYVSTGRVSKDMEREAQRKAKNVARKTGRATRFSFFGGGRVLALLHEWLDGASPPLPSLDIALEDLPIKRSDPATRITTWLFWASGGELGRLFKDAGIRLFHRNVRGYLGSADSSINQAMLQTLRKNPEDFFYLNNGVTIMCDSAVREEEADGDVLTVTNPQIINGQQTTRVLQESGNQANKADVLVRVLEFPSELRLSENVYDGIVADIVEATNHQNAIKATDLRANDRIQVVLEREFAKLDYFYIRKRQAIKEIRPLISQASWVLKKEDVARAVGACLEEGLPRRVGIDKLFDSDLAHYRKLFKSDDPYFYLTRWWLMKVANGGARGSGERQWAKYVVLYQLWQELGDGIRRRGRAFVKACENPRKFPDVNEPLQRVVDYGYRSALAFYRGNRGRGSSRIEVSPFFKRKDVYVAYTAHWRSQQNGRVRSGFHKERDAFKHALLEL